MRFRQMIVTRRADLKNRQQQDEQHMPRKQGGYLPTDADAEFSKRFEDDT